MKVECLIYYICPTHGSYFYFLKAIILKWGNGERWVLNARLLGPRAFYTEVHAQYRLLLMAGGCGLYIIADVIQNLRLAQLFVTEVSYVKLPESWFLLAAYHFVLHVHMHLVKASLNS